MDVTVLIGTYGDPGWKRFAERARESVPLGVPVVHAHGASLHEARNLALACASTEWVVHLDADDELEPGYIDALLAGSADIRVPSVRYVRPDREHAPRVPRVFGHRHDCRPACLPDGNYIVVGALARADLLRRVGGWRDFAWSEDWDLWLRCHLAGASFETIPDAVYRAHVRDDSRNRAPDQAFKLAVHEQIYRANFPEAA